MVRFMSPCMDGPCKGLSLHRLSVIVEEGNVIVGCLQGDLPPLAELAD